jgi:hypothetical protein
VNTHGSCDNLVKIVVIRWEGGGIWITLPGDEHRHPPRDGDRHREKTARA